MKYVINQKIFYMIMVIILTTILFSGCIENIPTIEKNYDIKNNNYPNGKINAPTQKFFGEEIEFDASDSFDKNGRIVSYKWNFGDNEIGEGEKVKHTYIFDNDFSINYPLIYSVYLFVKNDKGLTSAIKHQIKLYPKKYVLYLSSNQLIKEKPSFKKETIKCSGLLNIVPTDSLTYNLDESISIKKCNWNAKINLKKPLFFIFSKIKISLFDNNGNEIIQKEKRIGLSSLWKEKEIEIFGSFDK